MNWYIMKVNGIINDVQCAENAMDAWNVMNGDALAKKYDKVQVFPAPKSGIDTSILMLAWRGPVLS